METKTDRENRYCWFIESTHSVDSYLMARERSTGKPQWSRSRNSAIKMADKESAVAVAEALGIENYRLVFYDSDGISVSVIDGSEAAKDDSAPREFDESHLGLISADRDARFRRDRLESDLFAADRKARRQKDELESLDREARLRKQEMDDYEALFVTKE